MALRNLEDNILAKAKLDIALFFIIQINLDAIQNLDAIELEWVSTHS